MKVLLIFDQKLDLNRLKRKIDLLKPRHISIFPLSSDWKSVHGIESICRNANVDTELIESAKLIDSEVDLLREKISKWSADSGEYKISGKSIKEWFLLPKGELSTWWFSHLSEKNPLKTHAFLNIAQLGAISKVMSSQTFGACISSVRHRNSFRAIEALCKRYSIKMVSLPSTRKEVSFKERVKSYIEESPLSSSVLKALLCLYRRVSRTVAARLALGPVKNRLKVIDNAILFVSYFPSVDKKLAQKGILKNKYADRLQEKLKAMKKKIIWIWIYVFVDGHGFHDALTLAAQFTKSGEFNFFLDEFVSVRILARSIFLWLGQIRIFLRLNRKITDKILYGNLSIPEAAVLIRNLMFDSFLGRPALENILNFELYKEMFLHIPYASHCIYYSEMQAWEKALNAAKRLKTDKTKTVAFYHTAISENDFQYFFHPSEVIKSVGPASLPLPDIMACNGDIPLNFIAGCGYPDLRKVEAIRHLHLVDYLNNDSELIEKENVVLIAGSIDRKETKALISLFYEAFPKPRGFKVWLKGHPSAPIEKILEELNISCDYSGYAVKREPISELIKVSNVIFVGSSSVALEALTTGCKVILAVFSDFMFMNPLGKFSKFCIKIYNPSELREAVHEIIDKRLARQAAPDIANFISSYWCLDESMRRWEEILS